MNVKGAIDQERERQIVSMRTDGKTLEAIGQTFSIGRERVRQIMLRHDRLTKRAARRKELRAKATRFEDIPIECLTFKKHLDVRIKNGCYNNGLYTIGAVLKHPRSLMQAPNMGKRSVDDLFAVIEAERGAK
jgi:DNA-binding CsgD family transcriptional regulator